MSAAAVVCADYHGLQVAFTEDAWFNATVVAEYHGKRLQNWLDNRETQEYMAALADFLNHSKESDLQPKDLVRSKRGRNGGTWLHPDLAVSFARWLDVRFGVWCDQKIKELLRAKQVSAEYLPHYHELHAKIDQLAHESSNRNWAHANMNRLINKVVGIEAGTRSGQPPAVKARLTVAQEIATTALQAANDHHDGYEKAKQALNTLGQALQVKR